MNIFKIENAHQEFFNSKEEYLAFRQAWSEYITSGKAKKEDKGYSSLEGKHHLLYALLRGHDIYRSFGPVNKPHNNGDYYPGFSSCKEAVARAVANKWYMSVLLEPFNGTVTSDMVLAAYEKIKNFHLQK